MNSRLARLIVLGTTLAAAGACFVLGRQDLAMRSLGWIILGIAALAYVSNRLIHYAAQDAAANSPRTPTEEERAAYANPQAAALPAHVPATLLRYRLRRLAQWGDERGWADELEGHLCDGQLELQFFFSGESWVAAGRMLRLDAALSPASIRRLLAEAPISEGNAARIAARPERNLPNFLLAYNGTTLHVAPHTAVAPLHSLLFAPVMGDPADFDAYLG